MGRSVGIEAGVAREKVLLERGVVVGCGGVAGKARAKVHLSPGVVEKDVVESSGRVGPAGTWLGWAAVCGSGGVLEAVVGRAAMEPVGIGRGSVRTGRGSGVVEGGAGVRREAGPVASTRLALVRARGTVKTIAGAKRRRGTRVFKGGTKRGTLRGRGRDRRRKVGEEKAGGDVDGSAAGGKGGRRGLGRKRAEAALQGGRGVVVQSQEMVFVVVDVEVGEGMAIVGVHDVPRG